VHVIRLKIFVSSAKAAIDDEEILSGKSLTYNRNSTGPRIEPWGTPDVTGKVGEVTPRTVTC
jgi:hypothetical protein